MKISKAIICPPSESYVNGITTSDAGKPDLAKVMEQHAAYGCLLEELGVEVITLPAQPAYPDSTFVEDAAVILKNSVVITNPGAESRKGEIVAIRAALETHFDEIHQIEEPGTLDGGDVFEVGDHLYIGLTERTNRAGAEQLCLIAREEGFSSEIIPLPELPGLLHLKTAMGALDGNTIMIWEELADLEVFSKHEIIPVSKNEYYAANCILINGVVIIPEGYQQIKLTLLAKGLTIKTLEMSEFQKMDGGLSCLSLRIP